MEKYSLTLVMNYINGEDLEDYDTKELENDIVFMKMVFDVSNDKNMYLYLEDNLKKNFDFVMFLIDKFYKDKDFVIKVVNEYVDNVNEFEGIGLNKKFELIKYLINKFYKDKDFIIEIANKYMDNANEFERIELKILLCNYLDDIHSVEFIKFKFDLELFYIRQRVIYQSCIEELKDTYYDEINSLGFDMVMEEYNGSNLIKEYFAKNMLNEIFNFSFLDFERMIHLKFKAKKELFNMGINNFLINYVYLQDEFLAGYISVHVDLLDEFNKKIVKILWRWDVYEKNNNREKIEIIFEEIDKFVNENLCFVGNELEILKYILSKFGLKRIFLESGIGLSYFDSEFNGNFDDIKMLDINEFKLDLELYGKFKKFIARIGSVCQFGVVPDDYLEEVSRPRKKKGKILKLEKENSK